MANMKTTELTPDVSKLPTVVPIRELRSYIEDFAGVNAPLYAQNLLDSELYQCLLDTVYDFNESTPLMAHINYTISDFRFPGLLKEGAAARAFKLIAIKELRGEMQYTDGGTGNALSYKQREFQQYAQMYTQEYEARKLKIRRQLNKENCYGYVL